MSIVLKLFDLYEVPYELQTDMEVEGISYIRISPKRNSYEICLDKNNIEELIRALTFLSNEIN